MDWTAIIIALLGSASLAQMIKGFADSWKSRGSKHDKILLATDSVLANLQDENAYLRERLAETRARVDQLESLVQKLQYELSRQHDDEQSR